MRGEQKDQEEADEHQESSAYIGFAPALLAPAGRAVTCYPGGRNSKPSEKDTPWSDKKEHSRQKEL
jgi:hypothetical protein